mgnify:FL=1
MKNKRGTGWECIWDTGGNDTISGKKSDKLVTIDLRPATLAMEKNAGGYLSKMDGMNGGFLIAKPWDGTDTNQIIENYLIENAIGGSNNDILIGNSASNYLSGEDGNDKIHGFEGSDTLIGGHGNDKLYGQIDGDTLTGGKGQDNFIITTSSNDKKAKTTIVSDFSETQNDVIKFYYNLSLIHI